MSDQGAPPQRRPEDGWWHAVYEGPAGTLPDTPDAATGPGTVDDWFDSAAGMIGAQRTAEPAAPPPAPAAAPAPAPVPTPAAPAVPTPTPAAERAPLVPGQTAVGAPAPPAPAPPAPAPAPPAPAPAAPPAAELPKAAAEPPQAVKPLRRPRPEPVVPHVGDRPPTYGPEPTALPAAEPETLAGLVPDTALDGAQYGTATLRAVSVRGDSARYRGESRRDALLVTRFGQGEDGLLLAVLASPGRRESAAAAAGSAAEAARRLAAAIGRNRTELASDLRAGARDRLRYGLQRLTVLAAGPLATAVDPDPVGADRASTPEANPEADLGSLHCLLVSLDEAATHRAAFGTGPGALYLLRSGHWIDAYAARLLHHPDGQPLPAAPAAPPRPFRFRLVPATPGDILLLCTPGLAEPIEQEPAVAHFLSNHWAHPHPPGTVDFLRQVQVRAKGYADDRTAAALWTE
ncbi:protein phosphatase 2C domain-containing protein [Kitasatospora sp. NBC_00374]|uniref:protein phosphatase 2C domain-containing protein n=1 Tax=Kitasatospora sp. NBC_00374 TaxID=2975964 RepID=UPI0030DEB67B